MAKFGLPGGRWTRQPQCPARLDRGSTLVNKHSRIYSLSPVWPRVNLKDSAAISGVPASIVTRAGLAANFNGTSDVITTDAKPDHTGAWTAWAVVSTNTGAGVHNILSYGTGTAYSFQLRQNGTNYEAYQYSAGDKQALDSGGVVVGGVQFVAASWDGIDTLRIWRDKAYRGSNTTVTTLERVTDTLVIGMEQSAVQYWSGQMQYFGFAPGLLSEEELLSLNNRVEQIFQSRKRELYVVAAASGVVAADANSAGAATVTGVSGVIAGSAGASAGVAATSGVSGVIAGSVASSASTSTATGVSGAIQGSEGASSGSSTAAGVGADGAVAETPVSAPEQISYAPQRKTRAPNFAPRKLAIGPKEKKKPRAKAEVKPEVKPDKPSINRLRVVNDLIPPDSMFVLMEKRRQQQEMREIEQREISRLIMYNIRARAALLAA